MEKIKKWYQSKTKVSAVLVGLSAILGTVASWVTGTVAPFSAVQALIAEVGGILFVFGVRNLPFVNKK